jgi:hypothetical protein
MKTKTTKKKKKKKRGNYEKGNGIVNVPSFEKKIRVTLYLESSWC